MKENDIATDEINENKMMQNNSINNIKGVFIVPELLKIENPVVDDNISQYEIHTYHPYNSSTYNNNNEMRIMIQQQDFSIIPSKSSLCVYGRLTMANNNAAETITNLFNNAICYMFREIRYELNGIKIDLNKNIGIGNRKIN